MDLKEHKQLEPQITQSVNSNSSRIYCSAMVEKPIAETATSFSTCSTKTSFSCCRFTSSGSIPASQEPTSMIHGCIRLLTLWWLDCLFAGLESLIGSSPRNSCWLIRITTRLAQRTNVSASSYIGDGISTPSGKASQFSSSHFKLSRVQLDSTMIMQYPDHWLSMAPSSSRLFAFWQTSRSWSRQTATIFSLYFAKSAVSACFMCNT
jgi:hypothetical protein